MIDSFMMDGTDMTPTRAAAVIAADLVNTSPRVWDEDRLGDTAALRAFLADHAIADGGDVTNDLLERTRRVRDRLTEVFLSADEHAAVDLLNRLMTDAGVRVRLVPVDGRWRWHLAPHDEAGAVEHLAAAAAVGMLGLIQTSGRERLGLCAADGCAGVYVDLTRNRSRRYCIPEKCGNRTNLAAHRARRRAAEPS